ncbi:MAG: HIT family protein [Gammaproteobacteria bacterium]|nr:HIT family protein [Gammaproteobacteria bacterium]
MAPCPFCTLDNARIESRTALTMTIRDAYPVAPGHTLVLPVRHVASFFGTIAEEREQLLTAVDDARARLEQEFAPDGFNIGINDGPAAGQTVPHLHIHLIPRYHGDSDDPRGGVRWIFPDKARYW